MKTIQDLVTKNGDLFYYNLKQSAIEDYKAKQKEIKEAGLGRVIICAELKAVMKYIVEKNNLTKKDLEVFKE